MFVQELLRRASFVNVIKVKSGGSRVTGAGWLDPFLKLAFNFFFPPELEGFFFPLKLESGARPASSWTLRHPMVNWTELMTNLLDLT
jgi:hypothetical protein